MNNKSIEEEKKERYEKAVYEVRGCIKSMLSNNYNPENSLLYYRALKEIGIITNHVINYGAIPATKPKSFQMGKKQ